MGLFDFLGGESDFEEPVAQEELTGRTEQSRSRFSDMLNQIISRGENLQEEPRLSARDLFGEQMTRMMDSARSTANATKRALSRSMMAGGGDVTGAAANNMLGIQENTNQNISDLGLRFAEMANQINRQRSRRGDQLIGQGLQGIQNLFRSDQGMLSNAIRRNIQRESARKQRGASVFGSVLDAWSSAASGAASAAAACWVAETLYGKDSPRVHIIRAFLMENEGKDNKYGEFYEEYKKNGRQWAIEVTKDSATRLAAEKLFDELYKVAKAA